MLRDRLGLTGAKGACEEGECGSCSVLLDGNLVCSCLVLAASATQSSVVTVEGSEEQPMCKPHLLSAAPSNAGSAHPVSSWPPQTFSNAHQNHRLMKSVRHLQEISVVVPGMDGSLKQCRRSLRNVVKVPRERSWYRESSVTVASASRRCAQMELRSLRVHTNSRPTFRPTTCSSARRFVRRTSTHESCR